MISLLTLSNLMMFVFIGGTFFCLTLSRLPSLLRAYAFSSFALAGLTLSIALEEGAFHLYPVVVMIVSVKGILVPFIIKRMVDRSGVSMRLSSVLRATSSWFVAVISFSSGMILALQSPLFLNTGSSEQVTLLLPISIGIIFVGMSTMIIRRDIISQMIGFLVMENGIAAFALSALGGVPVVIEFGVYSAVLIGAVLMATLGQRVQELFGSSDTSHLNELID